MKTWIKKILSLILTGFMVFIIAGFSDTTGGIKNSQSTTGGEVTFTIRTVTAGGTYAPKHVLAIWVEKDGNFVKTRKAMANQRKQYLYTWKAASDYNVVDAITGATLTTHQTHTITWNCTDLDGNIVPDGDYVIWTEFTDKHAQGPLYSITFTKGMNSQSLNPPDETYFKDIGLLFTPQIADFETNTTNICQAETVTVTDLSVNASTWFWDFGDGAVPATANSQGPHSIYYSTQGSKTISLTINGIITESKENLISVAIAPEAGFSHSVSDLTITFMNTSANADSYLWDFGDGNTSPDSNPVHTYDLPGTYNVSLTAAFLECEDLFSDDITVGVLGVQDQREEQLLYEISPNPGNGLFLIRTQGFGDLLNANIFHSSGKLLKTSVFSLTINNPVVEINLENYPAGIYFIELLGKQQGKVFKVIKK